MYHFLKITTSSLALGVATMSISQAVTYPEPEITSIMFHVDKLPLDQDRMKNIANDLVILAAKNANGNQHQLNTSAKLLAIASRLNSKNQEVKNLNANFRDNQRIVESNPDQYREALGRTLHLIGALSRAEKHAEAHTFSAYLMDAMLGVAGDHALFENHVLNKQRWKNVVPEVADSPPVRPKPQENSEETLPEKGDAEVTDPEEQPDDSAKQEEKKIEPNTPAKWHFLTSQIAAPVLLYKKVNGEVNYYWRASKFKLSWKPNPKESKKINLIIKEGNFGESTHSLEAKINHLEESINKILLNYWKEFPGAEVSLELSGGYSRKNGDLGVLPIVTQLYASLKNIQIPKGVQMIGNVKSSGELYSDGLFWNQLKQLRKEKNLKRTLFCPANSGKYFAQLVSLEEAEFFIRNEVILVKDIDEVTQYFGDISDLNLNLAHEEFVKIRDLVGSRSVGSFSVNKKIRKSLEKIVGLNPNHVSAKMILLRGDTKRSSKLDPYFVAEEFKHLIESLKKIDEGKPTNIDGAEASRKADAIDEQLETVARYIDRDESDMVDALEEMSDELNNLARARKKKDSDYHRAFRQNCA